MKNKTLPALILSIAVLAGVMTSITDAYAQTTNTERLMTVVETTDDTNSMVAMIKTMLEDIQSTLSDIVSALTGLADGQDAIMDKQDALTAGLAPLASLHQDLDADQAALQSKIDEVAMMLSDVEMTLSAQISELEMSIADMQDMDTGDADLEAAVNNLNLVIRNSQTATDERLSALEQSLNERLTSIETQLGGVTEDITTVSEQVATTATADISAAKKGTAKETLTLLDYSANVDDADYGEEVKIDYNLKFECEDTVYINDIQAMAIGDDDVDTADTVETVLTVYHAGMTAIGNYTISQVMYTNPFSLTNTDSADTDSSVIIPDIQLSDIVLLGKYPTIPTVQRPITLEASDSFTIKTSMANVVADAADDANANVAHVFYDAEAETADDLKTVLDSNTRIDKEEVGDTKKFNGASDAIEVALKKADNQRIHDLAKKTELLEISVEWFSAVSDPKCTFTPIGTSTVEYPNQDNTLNVFTTVENIAVSATVTCNGQDTRIESVEDIKIGGDISPDNTEVGTLTFSAGGESIKINLASTSTFELADEDVDFPLEFSDTLEITGVIVPASSPAPLVIEIMYDTTAGNTCTQQ